MPRVAGLPALGIPAFTLFLGASLACSEGTSSAVPTPSETSWVQTWSDEFDGPAGGSINPAVWRHDTGDGCSAGICGWGNNEKQYYTSSTENISLNGAGQLQIVARAAPAGLDCHYGPCRYTSGKVTTRGTMLVAPGRVEASIKLPKIGRAHV